MDFRMQLKSFFHLGGILIIFVLLLTSCSTATVPTASAPATAEATVAATSSSTALPTDTDGTASQYEPVDASVCQMLQGVTAEALGVEVSMETAAPFTDYRTAETGEGCRLTAKGEGTQFTSPQDVIEKLKNTVGLGWTEQIDYEADGPMGSSTALTRDMGLMILQANWDVAEGAVCPTDQPIESCDLQPNQKLYTIEIDVAQYKATFSLDGHWEDTSANFQLDLTQDWKVIGGHHVAVAQSGGKIDSLEDSIHGMVNTTGANVTFQSSYTNQPGAATITVIDANTIRWQITQAPDGEFYLPSDATLTRK
jgi:hypothetical protein